MTRSTAPTSPCPPPDTNTDWRITRGLEAIREADKHLRAAAPRLQCLAPMDDATADDVETTVRIQRKRALGRVRPTSRF